MTCVLLFAVSTMLWQEDFVEGTSTMTQLFEYTVDIFHEDGKIFLRANPHSEGFASAWFYVDENVYFSDHDILELIVKVNNNRMRFNYYYYRQDKKLYYFGEDIVLPQDYWQTITIPLEDAKPYYSSNWPCALTPARTPALYIIIDNLLPGEFDVEIDNISVFEIEQGGER